MGRSELERLSREELIELVLQLQRSEMTSRASSKAPATDRKRCLLDRLLHHAVVIQIEGAICRLRQHGDLIPEHVRSKALITPPPVPRRRGRPPKKATLDHIAG